MNRSVSRRSVDGPADRSVDGHANGNVDGHADGNVGSNANDNADSDIDHTAEGSVPAANGEGGVSRREDKEEVPGLEDAEAASALGTLSCDANAGRDNDAGCDVGGDAGSDAGPGLDATVPRVASMARGAGAVPQCKSRGEAPAQRGAAPFPMTAAGRAAESKSGTNARAPANRDGDHSDTSPDPPSLAQPPNQNIVCAFEGGSAARRRGIRRARCGSGRKGGGAEGPAAARATSRTAAPAAACPSGVRAGEPVRRLGGVARQGTWQARGRAATGARRCSPGPCRQHRGSRGERGTGGPVSEERFVDAFAECTKTERRLQRTRRKNLRRREESKRRAQEDAHLRSGMYEAFARESVVEQGLDPSVWPFVPLSTEEEAQMGREYALVLLVKQNHQIRRAPTHAPPPAEPPNRPG